MRSRTSRMLALVSHHTTSRRCSAIAGERGTCGTATPPYNGNDGRSCAVRRQLLKVMRISVCWPRPSSSIVPFVDGLERLSNRTVPLTVSELAFQSRELRFDAYHEVTVLTSSFDSRTMVHRLASPTGTPVPTYVFSL